MMLLICWPIELFFGDQRRMVMDLFAPICPLLFGFLRSEDVAITIDEVDPAAAAADNAGILAG